MLTHIPVTNSSIKENETTVVSSVIGLLHVRTANQCVQDASAHPIPLPLCGSLWFEGEISILFADTNVGKSILAVQIADVISRGSEQGVLASKTPAQQVVYLDFELSDKQFEGRYSVDFERHHLWDSRFLRARINPHFTDFMDFEKKLFSEIEDFIVTRGSRIVIVDNITYLKMQSTESGKEALPLMKCLVDLKHRYNLSLLILAHTPKRLNLSSPLTVNDLAGSKQLANFADSIFCIGRSSRDASLRYIKQVKARSCQVEEQVYVFRLEKNLSFLGFTFCEMDYESNHLKPSAEGRDDLGSEVLRLRSENPDWTLQRIADETGTYKQKVKRFLDRHTP